MTTETSTAIVKSAVAALAEKIGTVVPTFVRYAVPVRSPYSGPNPVWDDYYCQTFPKSRMLPAAKD